MNSMEVVMQPQEQFIPTRQSLIERLKNAADDESWRTFFETYWRLIYNTGLKSGLTDAEAQDLVQDTVISVLRSMESSKYARETGSFKRWLLNLTHWRIVDQFRKRQENVARLDTAALERIPDQPSLANLDATWEAEWDTNLMHAAVERVKHKVDPRQWQIFDLYSFKDWPVKRITAALGVSRAKVYIVKHRLGRLLERELSELETVETL